MGRAMMRVVSINRSAVIIVSLATVILGMYSLLGRTFDVIVCLVFGLVGYFMLRYRYSVAAASLTAILASEFERTLRQGLNLMDNDPFRFFTRPITAAILVISAAMIVYGLAASRRSARLPGESSG